jgi:hypothetical protein
MDDDSKLKAMVALLHFIEAERILRPLAHKFETEHPELFQDHVEGVRAELKKKDWSSRGDHRTLAPLLKIVAPHEGLNKSWSLLPHYAEEYQYVVDLRNAIGHGDWERLVELGGSDKAVAWAKSFYALVASCIHRDDPMQDLQAVMMQAMLQLTENRWPWPSK